MNKKEKSVLYITYEFGEDVKGGAGRVINSIAVKASDKMDVTVAHINYKESLMILTCDVNFITNGKLIKKTYKEQYYATFYKLLNKKHFDIVHVTHPGVESARCIKIIKDKFPDMKVIYSIHSIMKYEKNIRNNSDKMLEVEEYFLNKSDSIHLLNNSSLNYFKEVYPDFAKNKNIEIIHNGIEEEKFKKIEPGFKQEVLSKISKDDIIVLCLSRWAYGKGIEHFVNAIPKVLNKNKKIKFIMAGRKLTSWEHKGKEYVYMIDKKIKENEQNVICFGWLDDIKRNTLLSIADISVMPSEIEYFPYSVLEPVICKVPLITSNIDCVKEFFEEDKDCIFFSSKDSDSLAEKILNLCNSLNIGKNLAQNSYKKVKKLCSWDGIINQYYKMYS